MIVYKLTDQAMKTYGDTQWTLKKKKTADGKGNLCSAGWLHWYSDPLLAVLHNPAHANFSAPRMFRGRASGKVLPDGGMKSGSTSLTLLEEMPLPSVSTEARV